MDWEQPLLLVLAVPAVALIAWFTRGSVHPMSPGRRRALLVVRTVLVLLVLLAVAGPALQQLSDEEAVIFVIDHSHSQGAQGLGAACARASRLAATLPARTRVGCVSVGGSPVVRQMPSRRRAAALEADETLLKSDGAQSHLAAGVEVAAGLFPPGVSRRLVLITDGLETRGDLLSAARNAAVSRIIIDAVPNAGEARRDVCVVRLRTSRARLHEGASVALSADIESSLEGEGVVRLFENGVEAERRPLKLTVGQQATVTFRRTPERRALYNYRVRVEGFQDDALPENDEAMALVDVRGRPLLLYIEGEASEAHYLADAMAKEGIRLEVRPPEGIPPSLQELSSYDGIILSDVPAYKLSNRAMSLIRDYVEHLGGGFLMVGGKNSFGVGGYYRTPIEDILPVKMKAPDVEQKHLCALVLVLDRSGSMRGQKIELCKSAAIATAETLSKDDYIGVVAFDSNARWVVPMTKARDQAMIAAQISTLNSGGGTNIFPGMTLAYQGLQSVKAKIKHMIVLSDGRTRGTGYAQAAATMKAEGITISSVGIGAGMRNDVLQTIAAGGGGQFYATADPAALSRIFTQDTQVHMSRLIREEPFTPKQVERHPMLKGWASGQAPPLTGYVKTNPKATAQVPLVTDLGDPLLAHWRFGLGKVTAFTSDCKSRWAALWLTTWRSGYGQFWAQVLREMARPPQGQHMDIRLVEEGEAARIVVDVREDAATYKNEATVEADIYYVPASALGSSMRDFAHRVLDQTGPGRYEAAFRPDKPGLYLVRARCGADMVSAGLVHDISSETATGRVNTPLLEGVCRITGGQLLGPSAGRLPPARRTHARFAELAPLLLKILLALFLLDLVIRRWENVLGIVELGRTVLLRRARS